MQQKACQFFHQIDKASIVQTISLFFVCREGKIEQCNKRNERTILA